MTDQIEAAAFPQTAKPTKIAIVTRLLSRPRGASLGDITSATGWQAHSIRSFLTGLRKKGLALEREQRRDGSTSYRLLKSGVVAAAAGPRENA